MATDLPVAALHALRDQVEAEVEVAVSKAMRAFLRQTSRAAVAQPPVLLAAARDDMLTLGEVSGWWAARVDADVINAIRAQWMTVYRRIRGGTITATSLDGLEDYMGRVRDRLVRGLTPPVGDDAFTHVRMAITQGTTEGWSRRQTAARIAADLGWETDGPYWRSELARADAAIDAILDPLGPPGHPVREATRLNDPRVAALQQTRAQAVQALDSERGYWQNRASRIATTEATGANNYAHLSALYDEEMPGKEWISAGDSRTRPSHQSARGQIVPVDEPFIVGGATLMFPGDPSGPAREVIRCRCVLVGAELPDAETPQTPIPPPVEEPFTVEAFRRDAVPVATSLSVAARTWMYLRDRWPDGDRRFDLNRHDTEASDGLAAITTDDWDALRALGIDIPDDLALEWGAWRAYTGGGFGRINAWLRGEDPNPGQAVLRQVKYLARQAVETTEDMILARGVRSYGAFDPGDFQPGAYVPEPGFTSATVLRRQAESYALHGWVFEIRVPAGSKIIMGTDYEHEVILPPGAILRVLSKDEATHTIYLELVEQ